MSCECFAREEAQVAQLLEAMQTKQTWSAEALEARVTMLESAIGLASTQEVVQFLAAFPVLPPGMDGFARVAEAGKRNIALEALAQKLEYRINSVESLLDSLVATPPGGMAQATPSTCDMPASQQSSCWAFFDSLVATPPGGMAQATTSARGLPASQQSSCWAFFDSFVATPPGGMAQTTTSTSGLPASQQSSCWAFIHKVAIKVSRHLEKPFVNTEKVLQREHVPAAAVSLQHRAAQARKIYNLHDRLKRISTQVPKQESRHARMYAERMRDYDLKLEQSSSQYGKQIDSPRAKTTLFAATPRKVRSRTASPVKVQVVSPARSKIIEVESPRAKKTLFAATPRKVRSRTASPIKVQVLSPARSKISEVTSPSIRSEVTTPQCPSPSVVPLTQAAGVVSPKSQSLSKSVSRLQMTEGAAGVVSPKSQSLSNSVSRLQMTEGVAPIVLPPVVSRVISRHSLPSSAITPPRPPPITPPRPAPPAVVSWVQATGAAKSGSLTPSTSRLKVTQVASPNKVYL